MKQLFINGNYVAAHNGGTWQVIDPATEEFVEEVAYGDGSDCADAIDAAQKAFPSWSKLSPWSRAEILKRTADIIRKNISDYARNTTFESGKPIAESKGEWHVAANLFEWYAEECKRSYGKIIPSQRTDKRMQVIYQPMGVIGVITAWNFPAYNPARAVAAALGAGCTVVLKASEFTPLTALHMSDALKEAGIPPGVFNCINGDAAAIGKEMLQNPALKKISFTGSPRVGKILMDGASITNTKLALELGGNAPVIIMDDVDIESVARSAVAAKFRNCGQVCIAPQRFYIHEKIYDRFSEAVKKYAAELKMGSGIEPETKLGPLINKRQQQNVLDIIDEALNEGNELIAGGEESAKGFFISPAIIHVKNENSSFIQKEIFGPVFPMIKFSTIEQVIAQANNTPFGLSAYVWTNNLQHAIHLSEALECGMVGVNEWAPHATEAPFGGWKHSGTGHESGNEGLLEYMEKKLISIGGL